MRAGRFREQAITFGNGATGRNVDVPSASPRNYHQAVSAAAEMPRTTIDGKLFLPPAAPGTARVPLVIVVPGSLGIAASHLAHAESLTSAGLAAFVLDPFGASDLPTSRRSPACRSTTDGSRAVAGHRAAHHERPPARCRSSGWWPAPAALRSTRAGTAATSRPHRSSRPGEAWRPSPMRASYHRGAQGRTALAREGHP